MSIKTCAIDESLILSENEAKVVVKYEEAYKRLCAEIEKTMTGFYNYQDFLKELNELMDNLKHKNLKVSLCRSLMWIFFLIKQPFFFV